MFYWCGNWEVVKLWFRNYGCEIRKEKEECGAGDHALAGTLSELWLEVGRDEWAPEFFIWSETDR